MNITDEEMRALDEALSWFMEHLSPLYSGADRMLAIFGDELLLKKKRTAAELERLRALLFNL